MKPLIKLLSIVLTAAVLCGADAGPQANVQPTDDLPNPFQTVAPWGKLPDGRKWGALNDVAIDRDGKFIQSFGKYGKVWYRIPDPLELVGTSAAEGIAVDARGNVYGG